MLAYRRRLTARARPPGTRLSDNRAMIMSPPSATSDILPMAAYDAGKACRPWEYIDIALHEVSCQRENHRPALSLAQRRAGVAHRDGGEDMSQYASYSFCRRECLRYLQFARCSTSCCERIKKFHLKYGSARMHQIKYVRSFGARRAHRSVKSSTRHAD